MVGKSIDINAANYCIQEEADLLIPANTAIPLVLDYSINSCLLYTSPSPRD